MLGKADQQGFELGGAKRQAWSYQVRLAGRKTFDRDENEEEDEGEHGKCFGGARLRVSHVSSANGWLASGAMQTRMGWHGMGWDLLTTTP